MNPQPANTLLTSPATLTPDARIDHVLTALRSTEVPAGLEARIAARLAQAAEARTANSSRSARPLSNSTLSFFAVILNGVKDPRILFAETPIFAAAAAAALVLAVTLTIHNHRTATTTTPSQTVLTADTNPALDRQVSSRISSLESQIPPAASHSSSHAASRISPLASPPDPDQIALAETLAPSRPAPSQSLAPQEARALPTTRPGQPIQLAQLEMDDAPNLQAQADARRAAELQRYFKTLLAPFALADALQPTTISHPQEAFTSTPASPNSNSN